MLRVAQFSVRHGNFNLLFGMRTAAEGAELYAHSDNLMIVEQGSATPVIGGTLADQQDGANGESKGIGIQNGVS